MKKTGLFLTALFAFTALIGLSFTVINGTIGTGTYKVDAKASAVNWKAYKVTGEHFGVLSIKTGSLQLTDGNLSGGSFEIDMNSITVTDMDGGGKAKLEGHLKSDDFFGANNFPVSKFAITKVVSRGTPGSYKVTGNLTIKETTKEIKFDAKVSEADGQVTAEANIKIDRSDYDIRYRSGSFFDSLGDKTIYDEFDLTVKLVASK